MEYIQPQPSGLEKSVADSSPCSALSSNPCQNQARSGNHPSTRLWFPICLPLGQVILIERLLLVRSLHRQRAENDGKNHEKIMKKYPTNL
jgi:hypothetical protein